MKTDGGQSVTSGSQRPTAVSDPALAAEPPAVPEQHPVAERGPAGETTVDRGSVQRLSLVVVGEQGPRVPYSGAQQRCRGHGGQLVKPGQVRLGGIGPPQPHVRLDEVGKTPGADARMVGRISRI